MGTRADFYVKEKKVIKWLGSIAWDGYEIGNKIPEAKTVKTYKKYVKEFLRTRDDATFPESGWPWPWNNSKLTDECYIFYDKQLLKLYDYDGNHNDSTTPARFCKFLAKTYDEDGNSIVPKKMISIVLPDMESIKNVSFGKTSGLIIISAK